MYTASSKNTEGSCRSTKTTFGTKFSGRKDSSSPSPGYSNTTENTFWHKLSSPNSRAGPHDAASILSASKGLSRSTPRTWTSPPTTFTVKTWSLLLIVSSNGTSISRYTSQSIWHGSMGSSGLKFWSRIRWDRVSRLTPTKCCRSSETRQSQNTLPIRRASAQIACRK